MMNNNYIKYLLNSFWWKVTIPFRFVSRKLKHKKTIKYNFIEKLPLNKKSKPIDEKISLIIFTYNAGEEFAVQLNNIKEQKMLNNVEIIVFDRGSCDNTKKYAQKHGCTFISVDNSTSTDFKIFERFFSNIDGEYVVLIDQNKIIDSKYWIYQSIRPLRDDKAVVTVFLDRELKDIKESIFYDELKARMPELEGEQMLFFPKNRDVIQYINTVLLDKTTVLIRKKQI